MFKSPKILVVDDNQQNLELLEAYLSAADYYVIKASNGEEALEKVAQDPPNLILLDLIMPKLDGFEVCQRLKRDESTRLIPIVMTTTLQEMEDRIKGIEAGADDYLTKPINKRELIARVRSLLRVKHLNDQLERTERVISSLALAVEARDPYTEGHCERMADFSYRLAREIGLPSEEQGVIKDAGILHDIGKIGVPDAVLLKPGSLTPEEFTIMKEHPVIGERICRPLRTARLLLPMIRHHHERMDGMGYPDGLKGEEIPIRARIITVADVYDALTTTRPYRPEIPRKRAIQMLREEAGRQLDPHLVEAFIDIIP
ncbi:MAG: response regulator [candidate division NC10 bacterium]|nr:response regulator [candidate division NC10 bacterium]